ncbi:MAG: hypothetical protein JSV32_05865 [Dehalococcoidia bacterium]|nr:MAG: hypothetical protein JSV32_05865 [Dehalococcoidia bacterium]
MHSSFETTLDDSLTSTSPVSSTMTTVEASRTAQNATASANLLQSTTPDMTIITAKITVDSSGFTPDVITISAGTVVIWKSLEEGSCSECHGSNLLSINPHSFDFGGDDIGVTHIVTSNSGLFIGELYPQSIFVKYFSSAGTYTYYDSLHPEFKGKIIVKES